MFVIAVNRSHLTPILQSILHYSADSSDPPTQKMSFSILLKMVNAWMGPSAISQQNGLNTSGDEGPGRPMAPLPGFDQFVYNSVIRVCFEVPMKQNFNPSDGQSLMVCIDSVRCRL